MVGLASLDASAIATIHPGLTALVRVFVVGANAMITGVLDIAAAIPLRKTIRNAGLVILNGVVSIAFGVLVFLFPDAGALALVWLSNFYAVLSGILLLAFAFRLRAKPKGTTTVEKVTGPYRTGACREPILDHRAEVLEGGVWADACRHAMHYMLPIMQIKEKLHGPIQN